MGTIKGAVSMLAFGTEDCGDNMFRTKMLLLKGGVVQDSKRGEPTLMGHAIGQAQELLGHWALREIEVTPEEYFRDVVVC